MRRRLISFLLSMALAVFAMAAGAACYHQYLIQKGMLRTGISEYIPDAYYEQ